MSHFGDGDLGDRNCSLAEWEFLPSDILPKTIQGDQSGRQLHFVDFDVVIPMSALFFLGSCKSGRIGKACNQHDGTFK